MGKNTLWEKEKLLITSSFSFSRSVFTVLQTCTNKGLLGRGLNGSDSNNRAVECAGHNRLNIMFMSSDLTVCSLEKKSTGTKGRTSGQALNPFPNNKILDGPN